jgi:hypothetical protein
MRLSSMSNATQQETMTIEALATMADADANAIKSHLHGLVGCNLAKTTPNGKSERRFLVKHSWNLILKR